MFEKLPGKRRRPDAWRRPAGVGVILLLFFGVGAGYLWRSSGQVPEPTVPQFNHKLHAENGVECTGCHTRAPEQASAGKPALATCLICHEEALTKSPAEELIRTYAAGGRELPWKKVTSVPDHVFFSHRRHVTMGKVACETCHGVMASQAKPPARPLVNLDMDFCVGCHERSGASVDCLACHR